MSIRFTGPLTSPTFPEPMPQPGPRQPAAPAPAAAAPAPLIVNQTASYAAASLAPVKVAMPAKPQALIEAAVADFDHLDAPEREQLNRLAGELGFASGRTLAHALRNLTPQQREKCFKALPLGPHQAEQVEAARRQLTQIASQAVQSFFKEQHLPPPKMFPPPEQAGELWDAASFLAVLNSSKEMQRQLPTDTFRQLAAPNGKPLEFERAHQPQAASGGIMKTLSSCMCIAHTTASGRITLYDPAISMNPQDILKRKDVQDLMTRLNRTPAPAEDVRSLQEMLNLGLPPNRRLPVDGKASPDLGKRLQEFSQNQVLKQSLDIVRDDTRLDAAHKAELNQRILSLQAKLLNGGGSPDALNQLLKELGQQPDLSAAGKERVTQLSGLAGSQSSDKLNSAQLELLVRNWFGMIDSGNQFDFTEQVINHEIGHVLQNKDDLLKNWAKISFGNASGSPDDEFMGETLKHRDKSLAVSSFEKAGLNYANGFGSDYARVNPEEDFAESFRLFMRHPEQLARENPLKFTFMAGATGKYAGREQELVNFLKQQGHSDLQLRNMVRILRGQNTAFVSEQTQTYANRALNALGSTAEALIPGLGLSRLFGYDPLADTKKNVSDSLTNLAAKLSDDHTPQFDIDVATMLPGMEHALGMQTSVRRVLPSQPGFVLDWLTDQCARAQGADPKASAEANRLLAQFANQGAAALAPDVRRQLPASELSRLNSPQARGMMLVLAHIHAFPQNQQLWTERLQAAGQQLNELAQQAAATVREGLSGKAPSRQEMRQGLSETKLASLIGSDLAANLPSSFRTLLREPGMLEKLSGLFGSIDLDSAQLEQEVLGEVDQREAAVQKAVEELYSPEQSALISTLADGCFQPDPQHQNKLILDTYHGNMAKTALQQVVGDLFRGTSQVRSFTPELADRILTEMADRLSQIGFAKPDQDLSSSNLDYLKALAATLRQELREHQIDLHRANA